jgi:hypothetical protein
MKSTTCTFWSLIVTSLPTAGGKVSVSATVTGSVIPGQIFVRVEVAQN